MRAPRVAVTASKGDVWSGLVYMIAIPAYLALIILPPITSSVTPSDIYDQIRNGESMSNPLSVVALGGLAAACMFGTYRNIASFFRYNHTVAALLPIGAVASAILSTVNTADFAVARFFNCLLTIAIFFGLISFWRTPWVLRKTMFVATSYFLFATMIVGYIWHGNGALRWVGGVQPNHFGRYGVIALFFLTLARGRIQIMTFALAVLLTLVVSSRTSLVGAMIFFICYYLWSPVEDRPNERLLFIVLAGLAAIGIDGIFNGGHILAYIVDQLALGSADRGLSSGLSGRSETYGAFFNQDVSGFAFGWGFQAVKYLGVRLHSGVLKGFYEDGIFLGTIFYLAIIVKIVSQLRASASPSGARLRACGAFAAASLAMTISEPDNFAIGFPGSVAFMLALASPVFLLAEDTLLASQARSNVPERNDGTAIE